MPSLEPRMVYAKEEPDDLSNAFGSLSINDSHARRVALPAHPPSPYASNQDLAIPHGPSPAQTPSQPNISYHAPSPLSSQPSIVSSYYPSPAPTFRQPFTTHHLTSPHPTAPASQGTISPSEYYGSQQLNSSTASYAGSSPRPTVNSIPSPPPIAPASQGTIPPFGYYRSQQLNSSTASYASSSPPTIYSIPSSPPTAPTSPFIQEFYKPACQPPTQPAHQPPTQPSTRVNIPHFPLNPIPRCPTCNWIPKKRPTCDPNNPNGNANRPFYICIRCKTRPSPEPSPSRTTTTTRSRSGHSKGWITWDDNIGIHPDNPLCFCPGGWVARQDRGGESGFYEGGGFWTCARGRCAYLSWRADGEPAREGRWDEGFEPWLLPPVPR
ncbi:MAG: hypothetical protein LQ350_003258 [Teloschistes chrysophthalmus]|nr:MAG: hypothetical protein LQ350_003258 [Niorma chrysophthalma]